MNHQREHTAMRLATRLLVGVAAIALISGLSGCRRDTSRQPPRQILPDMDDQPKAKSQSMSHFYEEFTDAEGKAFGRAMREPVEGTVPWGYQPHEGAFQNVDFARRDTFLKDDPRVFTGRESWDAESAYVEKIPVPVTRELLELGEEKFNIICILCHGGTGEGDGMVGRRWSAPVPSFHDPTYQPGGDKGQDGLIFWTIRNGVAGANPGDTPKMPAYSNKVDEMEAWAIVAYVRALQHSRASAPDARDSGSLRNAPVLPPDDEQEAAQ